MSSQIIQTEDPSYVRDLHSKALLNTDYNALQRHRREKAYFLRQQNDINSLKEQVEKLIVVQEEMIEIKLLLKELIHK